MTDHSQSAKDVCPYPQILHSTRKSLSVTGINFAQWENAPNRYTISCRGQESNQEPLGWQLNVLTTRSPPPYQIINRTDLPTQYAFVDEPNEFEKCDDNRCGSETYASRYNHRPSDISMFGRSVDCIISYIKLRRDNQWEKKERNQHRTDLDAEHSTTFSSICFSSYLLFVYLFINFLLLIIKFDCHFIYIYIYISSKKIFVFRNKAACRHFSDI